MRKAMVLGFLLLIGSAVSASEGFDDLSKLAKSGVSEEVLLTYIDASPIAYDLTVDEILFFNDLGVSQKVIAAAVKHGKELRDAGAAAAPAPAPAPAAPVVETVRPAGDVQDPVIGRPDLDNADVEAPPPTRVVAQAQPVVSYEAPAPVVAPAPEDMNLSYFYESLSPYGKWIDVDGSYVWQPTVVATNPNWRPYFHSGHWVYTDAGWAWHSDYSWGWAPFHYGRWAYHERHGWIWHPDTVWGPAWVAWRNSDTHCGWAPLPPAARFEADVGFHFGGKHVSVDFNFGLGERDYVFVPVEHVCETTVVTYAVPTVEVSVVFGRTRVIENPYEYRDHRFVNTGISVEVVARASHREIKPVVIVDARYEAGQPIGRNAVRNNEFVAYRPHIANEAPITPVVAEQRRQERIQREVIRQQAATDRTQIRQDNKTQRVDARQEARTQETVARQEGAADRTQIRQENATAAAAQRAHEAEARRQNEAAVAAENERARLEKAAERESDQKKQADLRAAAAEQRIKAAEAKKAQRDAQDRAEAQQKATEAAQKRQQEATAETERKSERDAEAQRKAADQAAREQAREQARKDAAARDAQEKAQRDAERTAREQARKDVPQPASRDDMGARSAQPTQPAQPAQPDAREARKEKADQAEADRKAKEAQRQAERDAEKKARDAAKDAAKDAKDKKKKDAKDPKDPNDPNN